MNRTLVVGAYITSGYNSSGELIYCTAGNICEELNFASLW